MARITNSAYADRLARAREEMGRQDVDYLFISPSSDLVYLLGYPAHPIPRLTALVVPRDGAPFVVVPQLEAPRLADRADLVELRAWDETADPVRLIAGALGDPAGRTISVSDRLWSGHLLKMIDALPGARFVNALGVLRELRQIKGPEELACMREAGRLTDAAWEEFIGAATLTGKTEIEVGRELAAIMERHGLGEPEFLHVASGPNGASPHHLNGERRIREGDAVVFDFGGNVEGYKSDCTRTVHVGAPSAEFRTVYDTVNRAREAAHAAVRPGVPCERIDATARDPIAAAGYGEYFIHRTGHGLGLDVHEDPYIVAGNATPLRAGMVFSDEPGIYLPGKFGVRIEDCVICTTDGGEFLTNSSRELRVVG